MFTIQGADGREYGPVPAEKIQEWIRGGRASLQTPARRDGEAAWRPLGDFPEFSVAAPAVVIPPLMPPVGAVAPVSSPVAGELIAAGRGTRLGAQLLDGCLGFALVLPGLVLLLLGGNHQIGVVSVAGIGLMVLGTLALLGLQIYLLSTRGQTVGKKLLSIKVVNFDDEANPGFVKAFLLRVFVNGLIGAVPFLGFAYTLVDICFIFRDDRRCLHDLLAGTKVVRA